MLYTIIHVVLFSKLIFNNKSIISMVFKVSKSPVGSSNKRISGSLASALAIVLKIWYYIY